jgi:transaldolase
MRKLENLKTKIFLDSGDPNETRKVIEILGFLDGQTTNPSLIAKNPSVMNKFNANHKFSNE